MITKVKKQTRTTAEAKRRKRILDAFGKFSQTKTSSAHFASRKSSEIKHEDRRSQ